MQTREVPDGVSMATRAAIDALFAAHDANGDGNIDEAELRALLKVLLGAPPDAGQLRHALDALDRDRDGVVSKAEFAALATLLAATAHGGGDDDSLEKRLKRHLAAESSESDSAKILGRGGVAKDAPQAKAAAANAASVQQRCASLTSKKQKKKASPLTDTEATAYAADVLKVLIQHEAEVATYIKDPTKRGETLQHVIFAWHRGLPQAVR